MLNFYLLLSDFYNQYIPRQYVHGSQHRRIMAKTHIPKISRLAGPLIPTYSCKECQKEFGSIHYLKIHMNNVHESSNAVLSTDDELDPLEFMKVELHEGKGGKTFSLKN